MRWLRSVGSIKWWVSLAEYCLFYRALLQKRPIILSMLLTKDNPYSPLLLKHRPPDPINYLCSLTGVCISQKCFIYRSVQKFQMVFQGLYAPGSDPPHKIMRYWLYSSTLLSRWFPPDQNGQAEMFRTSLVPALKWQNGWAVPSIFLHDS